MKATLALALSMNLTLAMAAAETAPPARVPVPKNEGRDVPRLGSIVLCAPGYPGNTLQAQPTMDLFARYVEKAAGLAGGSLGAAYYETEKGGLDRLAAEDSALALVPLPFYL